MDGGFIVQGLLVHVMLDAVSLAVAPLRARAAHVATREVGPHALDRGSTHRSGAWSVSQHSTRALAAPPTQMGHWKEWSRDGRGQTAVLIPSLKNPVRC